MHQLERDAQDDPFLMNALEGYEIVGKNQHANLIDLEGRLAKRVADEKRRSVFLWRVLPIAASVLIMLGAGYWYLNKPPKVEFANSIQPNKQQSTIAKNTPAVKHPILPQSVLGINKPQRKRPTKTALPNTGLIAANSEISHKADSPGVIANVLDTKKKAIDTNYVYSGAPVVRGYVKRNKDLTIGSSYIVTGKEVQDNPVGNVEQLLQGKVAGLNVQNNTGAPGMRGKVNIRGLSTIDSSRLNAIARDASKKYITVTGKITDKEGAPLTGTTIGAFGKGLAQADTNGLFTVKIPVDVNSLFVSSIGYITQQVKVNKQSSLAITMAQQTTALHETIIRGYVKRNRDETTGSSYIVTGKDAAKKAANNPPAIAGGKVPGKFLPINPVAQTNPAPNCNENLAFKETFFSNIAIVQKHTEEQVNRSKSTISYKQFFKALTFIARYSTVSINIEKGSTAEYPDLQSFQSEKKEWLDWYEDNKCNNLK